MLRLQSNAFIRSSHRYSKASVGVSTDNLPILRIVNGTFYRSYPLPENSDIPATDKLFSGLTVVIPSNPGTQEHWAVIGPSNAGKSTFFQILRGQHICVPPQARSHPHLSAADPVRTPNFHRNPARAIQYVGFDGERGGVGKQGTRGAYLSARYESRREDTDFSVLDYLKGNTDLNRLKEHEEESSDKDSLDGIVQDLSLQSLITMPMSNLSNGQTRRARIAKALLGKPMLLLLDDPFMGLDPPTITALDHLLQKLAITGSPRLILALRPQDPLPKWITHLMVIGPNFQIVHQGNIESMPTSDIENLIQRSQLARGAHRQGLRAQTDSTSRTQGKGPEFSRDGLPLQDPSRHSNLGETIVEMRNVCVKYGEKPALGAWEQDVNGEMK